MSETKEDINTLALLICRLARDGRVFVNARLSEKNVAFHSPKSELVVVLVLVKYCTCLEGLIRMSLIVHLRSTEGSLSRLGNDSTSHCRSAAKSEAELPPKTQKQTSSTYGTTLKVDPGFEPGLTEVLTRSKSAVILYKDQQHCTTSAVNVLTYTTTLINQYFQKCGVNEI